jgi:FkbM family methyltransferase
MKLIDMYYNFWSEVQLFRVTQILKIDVRWIVEAGCHDGTDTLELNRRFNPINYFAFEPDPVAHSEAKRKLQSNGLSNVILFKDGLGEDNSSKSLNYLASGKGSGSTFLADQGEEQVSVCRLDDKLPTNLQDGGLLWLDVEGHTLKALAGMKMTLKKLEIAKVEVQLHSRNENFRQDFSKVLMVFGEAGLVPLYGPLHPGYFGGYNFCPKSSPWISRTTSIRPSQVPNAVVALILLSSHGETTPFGVIQLGHEYLDLWCRIRPCA